ncbi:hypothetical protein MBAV_005236 [Candidatus Magnetobacterium bavaricum]|uniref:Uncharacterized protein n=1 Tax=Candidatus Magnetobacterium bavaricum TaxID=29290 RepID=A0A0F3GKX0_9BACT|nr:hypothetical protein MBAV_005236 [Candidatus Magnetobacterium bavaricum]
MKTIVKTIVIYDHPASMQIHRELFHFDDDAYVSAGGDLIGMLQGLDVHGGSTVSVAAQWRGMISLALWRHDPTVEDVSAFLLSVMPECKEILLTASADEVFEFMYKQKRFDCLRRLSNTTKRLIEKHVRDKRLRIEFHLVSEANGSIITSSL